MILIPQHFIETHFYSSLCGGFSSDEILCRYHGKFINQSEVSGRERTHEERGYPSAVYRISNSLYLDPYDELTPDQNEGVWLNHSRFEPNCRVVPVMAGDGWY